MHAEHGDENIIWLEGIFLVFGVFLVFLTTSTCAFILCLELYATLVKSSKGAVRRDAAVRERCKTLPDFLDLKKFCVSPSFAF